LLAVASAEKVDGEIFNIGSNEEISVGVLVRILGEVMGTAVTVVTDPERLRPASSEVQRLRCDASKLTRATGFRPAVPLRDGLARTARWFRDSVNLQRYKTGIYNV
jgi:nucleoside-diphosphate-sugar epimerase